MAVLTASNSFDDVYKLETTDPAKGGSIAGPVSAPTDGHLNAPHQSLTNRTEYLKQRLLPVGSVIMYTGTAEPFGWRWCDGSVLSRTTFSDLYSIIGDAYGHGNGTSTFHLPDFRGLFPRGWDAMGGNAANNDPDAASRTAQNTGGNTGNNIGSVQDDAFEAHTHNVNIVEQASGTGINGYSQNIANPTNATSSTGGNETRPKNVYIGFIIKVSA